MRMGHAHPSIDCHSVLARLSRDTTEKVLMHILFASRYPTSPQGLVKDSLFDRSLARSTGRSLRGQERARGERRKKKKNENKK